jgi:hypothetical protein
MGIQGILGSVFSGLASAVICWWFARCWKRGEVETRTGLYRADVGVEEYWFTMAAFGVCATFLAALSAVMAVGTIFQW